jgi:hypothetical protein
LTDAPVTAACHRRPVGCCGQGRAALRAGREAPHTSAAPSGGAGPGGTLRLEGVDGATLYALGAVTGRRYAFRAGEPLDGVDPRDAPALLASGFVRAID